MIIGHEKQKIALKNMVASGKMPHAFLFSGMSSLGKRTLAIEFLKAVNCVAEDACGVCRSCMEIEKGIHPDFHIVESPGKEISISQIRRLCSELSLKPHSAFFKTAIIDNAHLMRKEAQDSLLKTLEEPRGFSLIILISHHPEMLSSTILSRVSRFNFFRVSDDEIERGLDQKGAEVKMAIKAAGGRPGKAIEFLTGNGELKKKEALIEEFRKNVLSSENFFVKFNYAKEIVSGTAGDLNEIIAVWVEYLREVFLANIREGANNKSLKKAKDRASRAQNAYFLITRTNASPKLVMEDLFLRI